VKAAQEIRCLKQEANSIHHERLQGCKRRPLEQNIRDSEAPGEAG
jgi:hypothetical protein